MTHSEQERWHDQANWPAWYQEFLTLFRAGAGHCFIVSGDIHGVTATGVSHLGFMQSMLHSERRTIIVYYHRAVGIQFVVESMRAEAIALLGPDWVPPTPADDFALALDSAGIGQPQEDVFARAHRPADVLAILGALLVAPQARGRVALILDRADLLCPATSKATMRDDQIMTLSTLEFWGRDSRLGRQDNPVFLLVPRLQDIHADLRASSSGYKVIEQPLPLQTERLTYIRWYLQVHRKEHPIPLVDLTEEDLARNTAGLGLREVEDILLLGAESVQHNEHSTAGVSRLLVKKRKDAIIRQHYGDAMVILDPLPQGFAALGGMEQLITFSRQEVLAPLQAGRMYDIPKGILLVGPPGNGKTRFVEAAAKEFGYNALALRMSSVLGGIVGSSERNLQELFDVARHLAPTLLFIDEIDQTVLAQRGNSSGSSVASNLFGALLTFMGDEAIRGQVIVIGATNHPELIDTALLRPGRFDVIFPVLCPQREARRDVLTVQVALQETTISPEALDLIAGRTEHYSAADLEAVVKEARLLAGYSRSIGLHEAEEALANIRPVTLALVESYTRRALDACNNLRFLPVSIATRERERRRGTRETLEPETGFNETRSSRLL